MSPRTGFMRWPEPAPGACRSETSFWMGVLAERHRGIADDARRRVRKRYAKLHGRRWKALRRAMDELSAAHAANPDPASRPTVSSAAS